MDTIKWKGGPMHHRQAICFWQLFWFFFDKIFLHLSSDSDKGWRNEWELVLPVPEGCHDIQHNDTQHKNIQHIDIQYYDIRYNDVQHNELSVVMLSVSWRQFWVLCCEDFYLLEQLHLDLFEMRVGGYLSGASCGAPLLRP